MKSEKQDKDGNTEKAACLVRNFYTRNMNLEMSSKQVVYKPSTPVLTSEGSYDAIQVVNVTKGTEVICKATSNDITVTANTTESEKETEESVTVKVCNTTDTSAPADTKVEKANMMSMAVLGLRVLLAKSIAFNTLMSIKLFLF
ncbi:TRDC protein, partial [Geococcyx californianus]|nr:TRDC protein [Geococcyx californianus]